MFNKILTSTALLMAIAVPAQALEWQEHEAGEEDNLPGFHAAYVNMGNNFVMVGCSKGADKLAGVWFAEYHEPAPQIWNVMEIWREGDETLRIATMVYYEEGLLRASITAPEALAILAGGGTINLAYTFGEERIRQRFSIDGKADTTKLLADCQ